MKFDFVAPDFEKTVTRSWRQYQRDVRQAARAATDRASRDARQHIAYKMKSVGLGRLGGAVGQTSALRKRADGMWAVIYARGQGQPDSRGAGAIEAYTKGVTIRARNTQWLAFQTNIVPRTTGAGRARRRMTPTLYRQMGWETRLGKLEFRPISSRLALLVVKRVTISPKTGRGRPAGKRPSRTRINQAEAVVFVLIRYTRRARRLDHREIVEFHANRVPMHMGEELEKIAMKRGPPPSPQRPSVSRLP